MPGIRQVKALVAEREVRDLVTRHCGGDRAPVVKGWVHHFVSSHATGCIGHDYVRDLTPPPFLQGDHKLGGT